ncbi:response regulator [Paenibacillus chartarius]|uniref:Response regulator n=1 Tax=Paenibacillus chartarius TaxID=747481 RepID=A0ABV6DTP7_9BACL
MKALIVDDEEHVREAIELSVDWEKFGISQRLMAEDGAQALSLIREHNPMIVFCDMSMPRMDGPELLRQLREENGETQVIVISGHDDFYYTQAAIRAWGVDYLLKPFRKSDLEQAVARAVAAWHDRQSSKSDDRETEYRLKKGDALLEEQKLADYLKGEVPFHHGIRSLLHKLSDANGGFQVALVVPRNRIELVSGRFDGDGELFIFAVNNIAHEILQPFGPHLFCRLDPQRWVLLVTRQSQDIPPSEFESYLARLADAWCRTLGLSAFIGASGGEVRMESLPAALSEAKASLLKSNILAVEAPPEPADDLPRLSDQRLLLEAAVAGANKAYAAELIRSFTDSLRARGKLTLKELQACTLEANLLLERANLAGLSGKELADLYLPLWISDLDEWERLLVQQWWRLIESSGSESNGHHAVESMRQYINGHYQEDISLTSLSERFHFSPQYIAKKFKEEFNTTVVTYLTELRMEKARSLLAHTGMSLLEISEAVGYTDENYFGKVFKKHMGVTPFQYRRQEQKGDTR